MVNSIQQERQIHLTRLSSTLGYGRRALRVHCVLQDVLYYLALVLKHEQKRVDIDEV